VAQTLSLTIAPQDARQIQSEQATYDSSQTPFSFRLRSQPKATYLRLPDIPARHWYIPPTTTSHPWPAADKRPSYDAHTDAQADLCEHQMPPPPDLILTADTTPNTSRPTPMTPPAKTTYIQGVPGGMVITSGECSLC
jgi:hypothetical protein